MQKSYSGKNLTFQSAGVTLKIRPMSPKSYNLQAKYVHKLLVSRLFKPAQEKAWLGELSVPP